MVGRAGRDSSRPGVPRPILKDLQEVGRDLYRLGLVTSHGGNLSIRDGHTVWITGTGTMLGHLEAQHISGVAMDGRHSGPLPSSDTVLHSTIYALTPASAIVHAHPRHAIALSFDQDVFVPGDLEGQLRLEDVPVIAQGPHQEQLIATALQQRRVVLLRGHGAYAKGHTLWEALHWITALEESAHIEVIRRSIRARG
ncbi:MAG: fuculose-1-phosphate aldolase [Dehalococcoidia bacterium]